MTTLRVITFDLDDTLWDVRPVLIAAEQELKHWLNQHAPAMPAKFDSTGLQQLRAELVAQDPTLGHQISRLRTEVLYAAICRSGYGEDEARRKAEAAFQVFLAARNRVTLFDGVDEMLRALAERYVLGALSNGNADLEQMPFSTHFKFWFSAEQVGAAKPEPAMFHAAMAHTGCNAHEMLHVGDHPEHDVLGAARLGIHTAWVNKAGHAYPYDEHAPRVELTHVIELPQWLTRQSFAIR